MSQGSSHSPADDPSQNLRAEQSALLAAALLSDGGDCLTSVLDRAPLALWCVDSQCRFVSLSGQGLERLGYQPGDLIGRAMSEVFPDAHELLSTLGQALNGHEATATVPIGPFVFRWWCAPWREADGQLLGAHGVAIDVTEQAAAEAALRERETFFQSLAQLSPVGVLKTDSQGHCYYVNDRACQIMGLAARDILRAGWISLVHPADHARVEASWTDALARGENSFEVEFRFAPQPDTSASEATWVLAHIAAQRDEQSEIIGFIATLTDISDRKRTEQALQASEARWRLLLESAPEYILSMDPTGVLLFANRLHRTAASADVLGKNLRDVVRADYAATVSEALGRVGQGEFVSFEVPWVGGDGRTYWFENRMGPLVRDGQVTEIIVVASDITERKRSEAELRQSHAMLEKRVQARTDELGSVNRDLQSQKQLLELVLNSMMSGVLVVDQQGNLMLTNPAAHHILGLEPWETINVRDGRTFFHPDQTTPYTFEDHPLGQAIAGKTLRAVSMYAHPRARDQGLWLTANAAPLRSETDEICGGVLLFRDDTERRKTEESLRLSLERFDLTVHGSREGLWDAWINAADPFHPDNPIYYSPRFKESLGYEDHEFPNVLRSWLACIHPEDRSRVLQALATHLDHRVPYEIEYRVLTKHGVLRWFNARGQGSWDEQGRAVRMSGSFMDITARKEAEQALRASEVRYRRLVETANVVPWEMDFAAGRLTYVGPQAARLLGYPLEDWYGQNFWFDRLHPADREWVIAAYRETLRQLKVEDSDLEYRLVAADGSPVWVRDIAGVTPRDGRPALLSGFMFDVTDRKRAQRALQVSEARLQAILDGTPSIVHLKDLNGRYLFVNRAHEHLHGLTREQLTGKRVQDLFGPELAEQFYANDRLVMETDQPITFEETVPTRNGPLSYLSVKFPLHDPEGHVTAVCGISTDITERKQAKDRLLQEQDFLRGLLRAHERDRQLMAYEIHDGLVQDITAGLWHLEGLAQMLNGLSEQERATLQMATDLLRRSIGDARRVLSGLRPPILDEEGIVLAIQYLVAEQAVPGTLDIEFTHDVQFDRIDPLLEGSLFRIVQESLNNIKRHSGARRAEVHLTQHDDLLRLEIRDWGHGFDLRQVPPDRFGLQGIRKRAALLGGRGEIETSPGDGTRILVELPISSADPALEAK
ncbi:MAG TPA: PAS domain S-box protein [Pirellulales bacterium]|nr:PAS domain S-box protein [Pirellulales bacterium]